METRASKKRTNTNEPSPVLVPKRQRVVLEEIPDLNVPHSNLDKPICNKSNDKGDNQHTIEPYASDISDYLRTMEMQEKRRPAVNYMDTVQRCITTHMRGILVDWLVEVADEYKLLPETLHLAVSYVDRFLSIESINRSKLQLIGVSAMLIASKYEEITPPKAVDFHHITDNSYELHEVLEMETHILKTLNFEMGSPNVTTFLKSFVAIASENQKTSNLQFEYLCNYLADLSLLDYECIKFLPSVVAASVIFLAKFIIRPRLHPWNLSLCESLGYQSFDLEECVIVLHDLYLSRRAASLKAVRDKYKQNKFKCVANLPSMPELRDHYFEEVYC